MMTSLTSVQTKGIKRSIAEGDSVTLGNEIGEHQKTNGAAEFKKKRRWKEKDQGEENTEKSNDCNVIGLEVNEESSNSEDEDSENEEENVDEEGNASNEIDQVEEESNADIKIEDPAVSVELPQEITKTSKTEEMPPAVKRVSKPATFVPVHRSAEVQASRMKLPILAEEQAIVEAINENPVVILAGETGSGKTTQVTAQIFIK